MATDSYTMLALGDYRFALSTAAYQELERTTNWRWAAVDRLAAMPIQQYVGPGEETIHFSGFLFPAFRGGLGQLDAMRAEGNTGQPRNMVDGTGKNWGLWCITSVVERQAVFFSNGAPRRVDFEMSLTNYGSQTQ